jgi:hypothetical protein
MRFIPIATLLVAAASIAPALACDCPGREHHQEGVVLNGHLSMADFDGGVGDSSGGGDYGYGGGQAVFLYGSAGGGASAFSFASARASAFARASGGAHGGGRSHGGSGSHGGGWGGGGHH